MGTFFSRFIKPPISGWLKDFNFCDFLVPNNTIQARRYHRIFKTKPDDKKGYDIITTSN